MPYLGRLSSLVVTLLVCMRFASAASPPRLPYVPTTILLPTSSLSAESSQHGLAYIITPASETSVDLLALDISSTLSASSLALQTLTSGLPFLQGASQTTTTATTTTTAFAASLLDNSTLAAYVGDCASQSSAPVLWTASLPDSLSSSTDLKWAYQGAPNANGAAFVHSSTQGPLFLGTAMGFNAQLAPTVSPKSVYYYGGMCPSANATTAGDWVKAASYSNRMIKVSQPTAGTFNVDAVVSKGSPVAEAGFTFTPLTPSVANRTGTVTQQQSAVLLGGHANRGFVNMSEAAIWSLPQETWNIINIAQPAAAQGGELVKDQDAKVEVSSRSGHTAVLSADGKNIVVLGGWIGNVAQAAEPQLALLEIGSDFGSWKWKIPDQQPVGQAIFGHGAVVLPGNVMMVYGGYAIAAAPAGSARVKSRQSSAGDTAMFLNLDTMTWSNEYTNPGLGGQSNTDTPNTTADDDQKRARGLGIGLGVGLSALLAACVALFLLWRRYRRNRRRDSAVRALAQDASMFAQGDDMSERKSSNGHSYLQSWDPSQAYEWYTGGPDPFARGTANNRSRSLGYESLRGGSSSRAGAAPLSQHALLRKPAALRGQRSLYMPAPLESNLRNRGPGEMNIIHEADEDADILTAELSKKVATAAGATNSTTSTTTTTPPPPPPPNTTTSTITTTYAAATSAAAAAAAASAADEARPDSQDTEASDPFLTPTIPHVVATFDPSRPRQFPESPQGLAHDFDLADADIDLGARGLSGVRTRGARSPTRRISLRDPRRSSTTAEDDGGRTGSNLSERSAFSYSISRSGSRSRPTTSHGLSAAGGAGGLFGASRDVEDRLLDSSSGESSGGGSYNTARSSFAALQAEGPGLLGGAAGPVTHRRRSLIGGTTPSSPEDEDPDSAPGSPSKSKLPRSWLGSLRRVFNNTTAGSASADSRRQDGRGSFEGGDFENPALLRQHSSSAAAGAVSRRRRSGRQAWDGSPRQQFYTAEDDQDDDDDGGDDGDDDDDEDWDIEQASNRRMVQAVYTVRKEPLRVVNGEVERDDDSEKAPSITEARDAAVLGSGSGGGRVEEDPGAAHARGQDKQRAEEDVVELGDWESHEDLLWGELGGYTTSKRPDPTAAASPASAAAAAAAEVPTDWRDDCYDEEDGGGGSKRNSSHYQHLLLHPRSTTATAADRLSMDSRVSNDSSANHVIGTAEAVKLVRRTAPTTRVLEMVERIEEEENNSSMAAARAAAGSGAVTPTSTATTTVNTTATATTATANS